jgi:hypothetical protein
MSTRVGQRDLGDADRLRHSVGTGEVERLPGHAAHGRRVVGRSGVRGLVEQPGHAVDGQVVLDADRHQLAGVLLPPGVAGEDQERRGPKAGIGGEVERFPRRRHDCRIVLTHQLFGVRGEEAGPHVGGEAGPLEQPAEAADDGTVDRAIRAGLPGGGLGPGGERGDHQVVAADRLGILYGLLARAPGRSTGPGSDLRAQQPAEQFDALARFAGVGDGVGEERGGHVMGVARIGQLSGPHAVADGLR